MKIKPVITIGVYDNKHCSFGCDYLDTVFASASCALFNTTLDKNGHRYIRNKKCRASEIIK